MTAQVRVGRITASVTSPYAARVRIGRVVATVQAPSTAARVRIGRVVATVTPGTSTPSAGLVRSGGAFVTVTPRVRKAGVMTVVVQKERLGSAWQALHPVPPTGGPTPIPAPAGFATAVSLDNFDTLDPAAWFAYDNSTYGAPSRVQRYMARNVVVGVGSSGSTRGTSLKLLSKRETVAGNVFTAGMLDSKTVGRYYPRFGRFEMRCKMPHGQGLWPAWWLTARLGGANTVEVDLMEYFHSQVPGKLTMTLHRADNTGTLRTNVSKLSKFFEAPTLTPGWHTVAVEITPQSGDAHSPASTVQFKGYIDGVLAWSYLDTQSLWWTTNGGDENNFYNVYLQGCQIDGDFVGSPDGPLGYSHWKNQCLAGGTAPNSCTTTVGGYAMQLPTFGDPSSTFEIDYHRVWKYTG